MFGIFDIILLIVSLAVSLALLIPFTGVLVRFRANYNPKALRLDAEGEAQAHTGPIVESYISMFIRTWRIEGISGMYKGLMPTLISSGVFAIFMLGILDAPSHKHGKYRSPDTSFLGSLFYSLASMVVSLPTTIITYRAITTPYKLPWVNAKISLRYLLTSTERRKPWILYMTPGLMASQVCQIALVVCVLGPLRRWLIPEDMSSGVLPSPFRLAMYIVAVTVATPILTPLEVISTRLAIQRNHAPVDYNSVPQEPDVDAEDAPGYYADSEDVIGLRNEEDPYLGLADCFKRIVDEEGFRALFRAWWLTYIGGLGSAFA